MTNYKKYKSHDYVAEKIYVQGSSVVFYYNTGFHYLDKTGKEKTKTHKTEDFSIMKFRKLMAVTLVAAMAATMAVGCGGSSSDKSADSSADSSTDSGSDFDTSNDITIVSREDGSGTRGAFIELLGIEEKQDDGTKVDMTTTDAQITNNTSVMLTTVAGDEYAIGYVSLGSLNDSVKALKIDGAEATADNIENGSYKVSRPFNIAIKKDLDNEVAKDFMAYIMSTEGQKVVADEKYIPVSDVEAYAGSKPSGKCVVGGSSSVSPLMEKLIEAYKAVNPNAEIELQTSDSTTGMTSTIEGSYDIGMASRELKDSETSEGLKATVIATDGIAVIVNNNNPTDELSSDQVKEIYTGSYTTWDEVAE